MSGGEETFVCYTCAKGFPHYYDDEIGLSYFGQALTHAIAQYAIDETLDGIMIRVFILVTNWN